MSNLVFLDSIPRKQEQAQQQASSSSAPRIAFVTLGCKVNQSDTQKAIADFRAAGFRIVPPSSPAEVYVVNTCSVTHVADRKSRQWLRRAARANPGALVVATGCYAESGREILEEMDEVGLVIGYKAKDDLLGLVLERMRNAECGIRNNDEGRKTIDERRAREAFPSSPVLRPSSFPDWMGAGEEAEGGLDADFTSRTRAMVKIEDGCNDFCTFCIIPFTRGMPRSVPTSQAVEMVNRRLEEGYKEIVLTGVHMGKYGQDHAQRKRARLETTEAPDLPGVVQAVLDRTEVPRLRITSVEPPDAIMMLPLFANPKYKERLAPHLHLPLQSGCDATLERMKRGYDTAEFAEVVRQCREALPGIAITTDLITGFPGETDDEWTQTCEFVRSMAFSRVHVFPYSQRPGTPAASMPGQVSPEVRHARTLEMMEISAGAESTYAVRYLGLALPVLWEQQEEGVWSGLTNNYLRVYTRSTADLQNQITPTILTAYDAKGLWGEVIRET